jgi:hypothetical protein
MFQSELCATRIKLRLSAAVSATAEPGLTRSRATIQGTQRRIPAHRQSRFAAAPRTLTDLPEAPHPSARNPRERIGFTERVGPTYDDGRFGRTLNATD